MKYFFILALFLLGCPKKSDTEVFFENLENNQKIPSTLLIKFGVRGMKLKAAGQDIQNKKAGHHHILIDNKLGEIAKNTTIPMDEKNLHYGQAQSEAVISLPEGKHTLTLQFGDGAHRSYGKKLAKTITVFVEPN